MVQKKHLTNLINKAPWLVLVGYLLSFVEVYKYQGFLKTHTGMPLWIILLLFLACLLVYLHLSQDGKQSRLHSSIFFLNKILLSVTSLAWIYLPLVEAKNYDNYIFTKYHLHPELLPLVILFGASIILIQLIPSFPKTRTTLLVIKSLSPKTVTNLVLCVLITYFTLSYLAANLTTTFAIEQSFNRMMLQEPTTSKSEKMRSIWGVTYDFAEFVNDNTPPDSLIAIPPRSNDHPTVGNAQLFRYFVYPRQIINQLDGNKEILPDGDFQYIVIAKNFQPTESDTFWPNFSISASEVIIYNPDDNQAQSSHYENYTPSVHGSPTNWGLIRVGE
jgi:hypothetical protein